MTHISTYLAAECQNRSENITNRKLSIFYIENMYQLFFQLQQKIFFFGIRKKNRSKIFFGENPEKNLKFSIFRFFLILKIFTEKYFWPKKNRKIFLTPKKKYFSSELKKNGNIVSMQKIDSFRLVRFSERFRHSTAS